MMPSAARRPYAFQAQPESPTGSSSMRQKAEHSKYRLPLSLSDAVIPRLTACPTRDSNSERRSPEERGSTKLA